jgi:ribosomal-protein-alanine N-acetyltransferase
MVVMTASLRPMRRSDLPDVAALEDACFTDPWSQRTLAEELELENRRYVVASGPDGTICGYGGLMKIGEDAHVLTMAVLPPYRRKGIGTRLLLWLVERAVAEGAAHMTLEVRVSNEDAQGLYRRFGFEPVGVRRNYYRDEDALIMWAVDVDGADARNRLEAIRKEQA